MTIFLPIFYLFIGLLSGRLIWDPKPRLSLLLTKFIIPIVIIYNVSTQFSSMGLVLISTIVLMSVMLIAGKVLKVSPVNSLCFSYLNIGWLGLPIASSLFGSEAATIVISAYIGSSIIGNSVGAYILSGSSFSIKKLLMMPPVIALLIGFALLPIGDKIIILSYI